MSEDPDHLLMRKLAAGDKPAFALLFERYKDPLVRLLYQVTGELEDAEELTQETFVRLLETARHYRPARSFKAYLFKTALNLGRMHLRKKTRREKRNPSLSGNRRNPGSPEQEALRGETRQLVVAALGELSEQQRLVVEMKEFEGMTFREIALALEIPVGTVKSRLRYALQKLGSRLGRLQEH